MHPPGAECTVPLLVSTLLPGWTFNIPQPVLACTPQLLQGLRTACDFGFME